MRNRSVPPGVCGVLATFWFRHAKFRYNIRPRLTRTLNVLAWPVQVVVCDTNRYLKWPVVYWRCVNGMSTQSRHGPAAIFIKGRYNVLFVWARRDVRHRPHRKPAIVINYGGRIEQQWWINGRRVRPPPFRPTSIVHYGKAKRKN